MGVADDPEGQCAYPNFFRSRHTLQNALALSSYAVICTSKSNSTTPVPRANRASKWGDKEPPTIIISDRIRRAISITGATFANWSSAIKFLCLWRAQRGAGCQTPILAGYMVSAMLGDSLTMIAATFTTELSNIDSRTSTGAQHRFKTPFDNCAFAGQRTVLQHIPPRRTKSRHVGTSSRDLKTANTQSSSRIAHFGHHSRPRGVYLGLRRASRPRAGGRRHHRRDWTRPIRV